jgi:hypothetical protein
MSELGIVALLLACVWLGILTLVVVLLVRQVGLLSLRLSANRQDQTFSLDNDGPEIGSQVPQNVASMLPNLAEQQSYLLLASSSCGSCREVIADISSHQFQRPVTVLIPGQEELSSELAMLLPSSVRTMLDPEASKLADVLNIHSTPFAVELEGGRVTRKAYLYNRGSDFIEFVEQQGAPAEANGLVEISRKATERKVREHA